MFESGILVTAELNAIQFSPKRGASGPGKEKGGGNLRRRGKKKWNRQVLPLIKQRYSLKLGGSSFLLRMEEKNHQSMKKKEGTATN